MQKRLPRMPAYYEHALAIAKKLRRLPNVEIVPDPPQTPMMHLHLRVEEGAFLAAAHRIAEEQDVFTWARTSPADTPSVRVVELAVGDGTMGFTAEEVAGIVEQLVAG